MPLSPSLALAAHARSSSRADGALAAGLLVFACAWLLLLAFTRHAPPLDNVEQWVWSQGLALGYYKHPPLPTWLAFAVHAVAGRSPIWISVMGAACLVGTLWLYAKLLSELCGRAFAHLAVLAALCITYATLRIDLYNHNTVMMPLMAGVACLMWRVTVAPRLRTWLGIGVLIGLGLLTKYQFALIGACVALWWLRIGGWRQRVHLAGALLAALAAVLVFMPHAWWLVKSDWAPLHYASQSSLGAHLPLGERPAHVVLWMLDWLGNRLLPAWVLLALAWFALRRYTGKALKADPQARDLLLFLGWLPPILMVLLGLFTGMRLQFKWSTAFWMWTIPAVMVTVPAFTHSMHFSRRSKAIILGAFVLLQAGLILWQVKSMEPCPPEHVCPWAQRSYDEAALAADAFSRERLGGPVQILSGPYGVTGLLAQQLRQSSSEVPAVLIDGELEKSPWLDAQTLAASRVVQVWPGCKLPAGAERIMPGWYVTLPGPDFVQSPAYLQSETWRIASDQGGGQFVQCP